MHAKFRRTSLNMEITSVRHGNYLSKQSVSVADRAVPRALSNDAHLSQITNRTTQECKHFVTCWTNVNCTMCTTSADSHSPWRLAVDEETTRRRGWVSALRLPVGWVTRTASIQTEANGRRKPSGDWITHVQVEKKILGARVFAVSSPVVLNSLPAELPKFHRGLLQC